MKSYDTAIILGSRPLDGESWAFPSHVYGSLDKAVELYKQKAISYITVSGKWTINFDILHIHQPYTEAGKMAEYLISKGIPKNVILRESESKDTISNIYYLKKQLMEPRDLHNLIFIAAEPRLERIKFLCQRILGPAYSLSFEGVDYAPGEVSSNESRTLTKQAEFLLSMKDGEDSWLDGKFYVGPFYDAVRTRVIEGASKEPLLYLADPQWKSDH